MIYDSEKKNTIEVCLPPSEGCINVYDHNIQTSPQANQSQILYEVSIGSGNNESKVCINNSGHMTKMAAMYAP